MRDDTTIVMYQRIFCKDILVQREGEVPPLAHSPTPSSRFSKKNEKMAEDLRNEFFITELIGNSSPIENETWFCAGLPIYVYIIYFLLIAVIFKI